MVHHVSRIHPHPSSPEDRRRRRQHLQLQFLRADLTISVWGDNILIGWMSRYDASAPGEGQHTVERSWFGYAESPFQRIRISFVYNLLGMCKGLHLLRTVVLVWDWADLWAGAQLLRWAHYDCMHEPYASIYCTSKAANSASTQQRNGHKVSGIYWHGYHVAPMLCARAGIEKILAAEGVLGLGPELKHLNLNSQV